MLSRAARQNLGQNDGQKGRKHMARHGENIRKRKDGRWEGRYSVTDSKSGRTRSCSVYAKNYMEVKEKLSLAKHAACAGAGEKEAVSRGLVFDALAEEWLSNLAKQRKHSTCVKYGNIYNRYIKPIIGSMMIDRLTQKNVNDVAGAMPDTSASIQKSVRNVTNQILKYISFQYGAPAFSLVFQTSKPAGRPVETLTKTEQKRLVEYLCVNQDIYKVGILLCLAMGLRLGEICALKWSDIDFESGLLYVNRTVQRISVSGQDTKTVLLESDPKSSFSKRELPMADEIARLLLPYKSEGYLFKKAKPLEPRTYQNKYAKYLEASGIRKSHFHILRHTFATNCIDSGMDVKSLSEILGHADVKITLNRYVHPTMDTKRNHMNTLAVVYFSIEGQTKGYHRAESAINADLSN